VIYGYARVSTVDQELEAQILELQRYGVDKIYQEKVTGTKLDERKVLRQLIDDAQPGDKIVFTKLDRFARNLLDALKLMEELKAKQVDVVMLDMNVDTSTPAGELIFRIFAAVAEFEVKRLKERQRAGIELAKKRGVYKGRPRTYTDKHKGMQHALKLAKERDQNGLTIREICEITKVSRAALYRELQKENRKNGEN
jgi:DNA invertase Pin-like site-specific DNA recombinase